MPQNHSAVLSEFINKLSLINIRNKSCLRYFLVTFFILSILSCKEKTSQLNELAEFFSHHVDENEPVATIDFNKHGEEFIEDIDRQLNQNLCDDSRFTAKVELKENTYRFPSFTIKDCPQWNGLHFSIDVMINPNNQIFLYDWDIEIIPNRKFVAEKIRDITSQRFNEKERSSRIVYTISWSEETDPKIFREVTTEVLKGVKNFSDQIAQDKFQKTFNRLTDTQKQEILKDFKFKVGFVGKRILIPPPPPPARQTP